MMFKKLWFDTKIWFFSVTGLKFTSEQWQNIFPEIKVLDPDGWDRRPENFGFEWYIEKITIEEYMNRVTWSTIIADVRLWNN